MSKEKQTMQILWERNQLLLFMAKLYPCWLEPNSPTFPEYRLVMVLPFGLMSWDIPGDHLRYFDSVERKDIQTGQLLTTTTSEKYTLMREMPQQWTLEPIDAPEVDENQLNLI